jgi:hypothetical protein
MNVDSFQRLPRSACGQSVDGLNPILSSDMDLPWQIYGHELDAD